MRKFKVDKKGFVFSEFSLKQKILLYWWHDESIYKDNDIVIADGAIRSGKTIGMIVSFLKWSQSKFVAENFIVAGKSVGSLKRNVIKPLISILINFGWKFNYNRSENFIEIGNNTYYLFGANNESSQDTLQGLTSAGALADEIALFPKSFVEQMIGRCSIEGSKIFCNCNPENPYHFFKTDYIDKAEEKKILYLHFDMSDNLTLSENVKDRYKRMYQGIFHKRYILGLWVIAEGVIYDMFDESRHVIDTSNIVCNKFYVSCDYGVYNALSFGLWGNDGTTWHRLKEYYYSGKETGIQKDNENYYKELEKFIGDKNLLGIIIDPSASSFIQTIKKYNRYKVIKANNDVNAGIENVAVKLVEDKIKIDKSCKNIIKEFYSYMWDDKAAQRGEDKPIKQFDHCLDDCRYFVNTILPIRKKSMFD